MIDSTIEIRSVASNPHNIVYMIILSYFSPISFYLPQPTFISDLNADFVSELRCLVYSWPFSRIFSSLPHEDKKEMKAIYDKYRMTGSHAGRLLSKRVIRRQHFEVLYLKSEDPNDLILCRFTRGNGVPYSKKYNRPLRVVLCVGIKLAERPLLVSWINSSRILKHSSRRERENQMCVVM